MSLFWGIVLAGLGAYAMRASFVVLLSGVTSLTELSEFSITLGLQ